jgi:hypothetical protein
MSTFWAIVRNEARLLWRQASFWVIQGLLLLSTPLSAYVPVLPIPTALVLLYLVIPVLVGPALLREAGKSGEIVWSSPTSALTHYAGMLVGLWLGLLPASFLHLAGWFLAYQFSPNLFSVSRFHVNNFSFWIWPVSLAFLLLANTVALLMTALLAMLVRRMKPLLILWSVLWLVIFVKVIFGPAMSETPVPMQENIFINVFFHNLRFSPSLGLGLSQERVFSMAAWFLGLGLLAASLGLAVSLLGDRRRSLRNLWVLPVLILAGGLATGSGYALNARAAAEFAVPISPYDPQIDVWQVERQQTQVQVDASRGTISGTSLLTLTPLQPLARPELVLRLNPGLELSYARDGVGTELPARRVGDSLVVSLPAAPSGPIQLDLAWQGSLQISYLSFEQRWAFQDFPYEIPFYSMPVPLKALLVPQGGFLLRDGDWKPWPWSSRPHQAAQNSLLIRPVGGEAVASHPLQGDAVAWDGELPKGLLAFLPAKQIALGSSTLAVSPLAGSQHETRARLFEAGAVRLSTVLGERPPRYIVVAPYLSELVWSGDLLLIPDGSGAYQSIQLFWVFNHALSRSQWPLLERNVLFQLARAWIQDHFDPSLPFQPLLSPPGEDRQVISIAETSEESWYQGNGHWMQFAEALDTSNNWTPVTNYQLTLAGEQSVLAFWLAMELVDEDMRQADLELLAYFAGVDQQLQGHPERYKMISDRLWSDILYATQARELVWDLHAWALQVGPGAVPLAIEVIQGTDSWDLKQVLAEMEAGSGVPIEEGRP